MWDPAAHAMLAVATALAVRRRAAAALIVLAGVWAYCGSVVLGLAASTHMSGRHFAVPLFVSTILFIASIEHARRRTLAAIGTALVAYLAWTPISPFKFGTRHYQAYEQDESSIDTKWFVYQEGSALLNWRPGLPMPDHEWFYRHGEQIRNSPLEVFMGVAGHPAVGYAGFKAGPNKFIIDVVGLTDPLTARLPATVPESYDEWKSGHFYRSIPLGYVESVDHDYNVIEDDRVRAYYTALRTITRDPIFSRKRFATILAMNLGRFDHLLHRSYEAEPVPGMVPD
jgi:arabinofuranosyltransferase